MLETKNLSFKYALSNNYSLKNVNLQIAEGDFVLLFGKSGSSKTTLLRQFKPELTPKGTKSGEILLNGKNIEDIDVAISATKIGYVSQNPDNQIVTDKVYSELAFGLENLNLNNNEIRRKVSEMASFFGIGSWFNKKTSELSGGQKQILNLASVLSMQPEILLLDEPTSQLDPIAAREFLSMVFRLNQEFTITVIMSEHRLDEILPVANKLVLLENGSIKVSASPQKVIEFLKTNNELDYIKSLPVPTKVFSFVETDKSKHCPLTVKEGKEWLEAFVQKDCNFVLPKEEKQESLEKILECKNLYFKYQKNEPLIIKALSLTVYKGEILSLMGENGCGKSTLFGLLTKVLKPILGKINYNGKNLRSYGKDELYSENMAFLPQNPKSIFLSDKLYDDLAMGEEFVKELGIQNILSSHPYDVSGGELQKAAFAKVLIQKPKLLLLDEPTKGLDFLAKEALGEILYKLQNKGVTIILSTHDVEFAAKYSTRCALMFDGDIATISTPRAFFAGSCFYTTAANRMARGISKDVILSEDVIKLCSNQKVGEI